MVRAQHEARHSDVVPPRPRPWNHNTRYHRTLLHNVAPGTGSALDVGCGDGTFAWQLASRCIQVVALDPDERQVARTLATCQDAPNVTAVHVTS